MRKKVKISSLNPGDEFYFQRAPRGKRVVYEVKDEFYNPILDGGFFYYDENFPNQVWYIDEDEEVWVEVKTVMLKMLQPGESFKIADGSAICVWTVCEGLHNGLKHENEVLACSDHKITTFREKKKVIPVEKNEDTKTT